jgi:hypothetical protein
VAEGLAAEEGLAEYVAPEGDGSAELVNGAEALGDGLAPAVPVAMFTNEPVGACVKNVGRVELEIDTVCAAEGPGVAEANPVAEGGAKDAVCAALPLARGDGEGGCVATEEPLLLAMGVAVTPLNDGEPEGRALDDAHAVALSAALADPSAPLGDTDAVSDALPTTDALLEPESEGLPLGERDHEALREAKGDALSRGLVDGSAEAESDAEGLGLSRGELVAREELLPLPLWEAPPEGLELLDGERFGVAVCAAGEALTSADADGEADARAEVDAEREMGAERLAVGQPLSVGEKEGEGEGLLPPLAVRTGDELARGEGLSRALPEPLPLADGDRGGVALPDGEALSQAEAAALREARGVED